METHLSEESLWASGLAARLRLLQSSFADDDPATRKDFIVQEIQQSLKGYGPDKRQTLLRELQERFPSWEAAPVAPEPAAAPLAPAPPETPQELMDRLVEVLPELSPGQRLDFAERLKLAGLAIESRAGGKFAMEPELQKKLGLDGNQQFEEERVARTFALLLDNLLTLDKVVWVLWREVAPRSLVRRKGDFSRLTGQYLGAHPDISVTQVMQALEETRRMILSLLSAIKPGAGAFARAHANQFEPETIKAAALGTWTTSKEVAAWRVYENLYREHGNEGSIERAIIEALAKVAEGRTGAN